MCHSKRGLSLASYDWGSRELLATYSFWDIDIDIIFIVYWPRSRHEQIQILSECHSLIHKVCFLQKETPKPKPQTLQSFSRRWSRGHIWLLPEAKARPGQRKRNRETQRMCPRASVGQGQFLRGTCTSLTAMTMRQEREFNPFQVRPRTAAHQWLLSLRVNSASSVSRKPWGQSLQISS